MRKTLKVGDRVRRKRDYQTFSWEYLCTLRGYNVNDVFVVSRCFESGKIKLYEFGSFFLTSENFEKINKKCVNI